MKLADYVAPARECADARPRVKSEPIGGGTPENQTHPRVEDPQGVRSPKPQMLPLSGGTVSAKAQTERVNTARSTHAVNATAPSEDDLRSQVRAALYEDIPSERIVALAALGRERAAIELQALADQIVNERGLVFASAEQREQITSDVLNMVLGLGPIEGMLADPSITEIMVVGASKIFFERDGCIVPSSERFTSEEQLRLVVDRIVSPLGRRIDEQSPIVNARLPEGHRVNAIIPPVSMRGTTLTIRKFREVSFTLAELVGMGSLSPQIAQLLAWAVHARKNIAVSGGTGGGKTTLLNALSREIPPTERIITIEDSAELRFDHHPHVVQLEARMANAEGHGEITIRELVINALRQRPDRIIVGECRGPEALDMLQAMTTGHDGSMTTLHANSTAEVVMRLTMMVRYGVDLPPEVIRSQVLAAIDVIVQQDRVGAGKRMVTQVAARCGDTYAPVVVWNRRTGEYEWQTLPAWLDDLPYLGVAHEEELAEWKSSMAPRKKVRKYEYG